jgi:hypothetical protein
MLPGEERSPLPEASAPPHPPPPAPPPPAAAGQSCLDLEDLGQWPQETDADDHLPPLLAEQWRQARAELRSELAPGVPPPAAAYEALPLEFWRLPVAAIAPRQGTDPRHHPWCCAPMAAQRPTKVQRRVAREAGQGWELFQSDGGRAEGCWVPPVRDTW